MHDLTEIIQTIPSAHLDLRYATTNNITGRALYNTAKAYLVHDACQALLAAADDLASQGFELVIWDAYRPLSVSKVLWSSTPSSQKDYVANPSSGSIHNRGCAVDMTLYDVAAGTYVNMPSNFDDFSERAWPEFTDVDMPQHAHRDLLRQTMEQHGFAVDEYEWWHFDWHEWQKYPVLDIPIEAL